MADFGPLNDAERIALGLLAQGHTAKSIADITGRSVGSINERLREARRKTGVGSSRELARLFAAQKNRDEFIEVAPPQYSEASIPQVVGAPVRRSGLWIGVIVMSVIAALALGMASTSWWSGQGPAISSPEDQLHAALIAEARNEAWAGDAERRLDAIYGPVRSVGPVTVTCRRSLCEISGEIAPGDAATATAALQSNELNDRVRASGFAEQLLIKFSTGPQRAPRFVTFWRAAR